MVRAPCWLSLLNLQAPAARLLLTANAKNKGTIVDPSPSNFKNYYPGLAPSISVTLTVYDDSGAQSGRNRGTTSARSFPLFQAPDPEESRPSGRDFFLTALMDISELTFGLAGITLSIQGIISIAKADESHQEQVS